MRDDVMQFAGDAGALAAHGVLGEGVGEFAVGERVVGMIHWYEQKGSAGAYAEAIDRFDRVLAFDPTSAPIDGPAYEERLIGELSHDGRGMALFKAGRYSEAAEAYRAAERLAPTNPAYAVKRKLASARSRGGVAGAS